MHSNTQAELTFIDSVTELQQIMTGLNLVESDEDCFSPLYGFVMGNKSLKSSTLQWASNTLSSTLFSVFPTEKASKREEEKLKCL
jgi:hypothetical protein